jgi:hypothetical protein
MVRLLLPCMLAISCGAAVVFDGTDDLLNCGSEAVLDNLTASNAFLTVSCWIKIEGSHESTSGRIIDKRQTSVGWYFGVSTNRLRFYVDRSTTDCLLYSAAVLMESIPTHVSFVLNNTTGEPTNGIRFFINGTNGGISSSSANIAGAGTFMNDAAQNLLIGNITSAAATFSGHISHVALWNAALSDNEIAQLSKPGFNPLKLRSRGLIGYWPLDSVPSSLNMSTTSHQLDLSGNGNHAIPSGSPATAPGPIPPLP